MGEKSTFRGALIESRKVVREAAIRARDAMDPGLRVIRDAAGRIKQIANLHAPRVDRAARTVERDHSVYEVQERDGSYTVRRRDGHGGVETIGSFDVSGARLTIHCGNHPLSEVAMVAAAWLDQPSSRLS